MWVILLSPLSGNSSIQNVFPGVPVERLLQACLVQCMPDEADAPGQDEETVEVSHSNNVFNLRLGEHGRGVEKIQEQCADATVHVHDQIGRFLQGVGLHRHSVVQVTGAGEEAPRVRNQQLHPLVAVVLALDAVADPGHPDAFLLHALHKLVCIQTLIACSSEVAGCIVNRTSEAWPDGEQSTHQAGHQIFPRSAGHDGVVRP
mmetsp:Transcript_7913/g.23316  ORF Transcript_7913/g.23316 Transcript_7913/m.23316 type:complete len:203 (+) Transcript_7913:2218-2826(+)